MCIIIGSVESVQKTKIFVLPNESKTRQMTFYSNAVESPDMNMMILPVPYGADIELHSIHYNKMFEDLRKSVSRDTFSISNTLSRSVSAYASHNILPVFDHGSYRVSIANRIEDLLRLNSEYFEITPELYRFFAKHYSEEFGYLCCVLKPGQHEYEPLCYSHPMLSSGKLFVPTLHYHIHGNHVETEAADWDHLLFSVDTTERANTGYSSNYHNVVDWRRFPPEYQKNNTTSVRCAEIKGFHRNQDIAFEVI